MEKFLYRDTLNKIQEKAINSNGAGTEADPFTDLNVKRVPINIYHKIKENRQNVVTKTQFVDGVIIIDGVNTIL